MKNRKVDDKHSKIIDKLGGTTVVSKIFGISPQAVSKWRKNGIPKPNLMYLCEKYQVVCDKS